MESNNHYLHQIQISRYKGLENYDKLNFYGNERQGHYIIKACGL